MTDNFMYIPNNYTKYYPFCRLNKLLKRSSTKLNKPTNHIQLKSPKLLSQRIGKRYYKTLRTSLINSPLSPPSLYINSEKDIF